MSSASRKRRILCVGMCVLDIVHVVQRFPEENSYKRCLTGYCQRGGNASNSCTVLRNLGVDCEFLGMTSNAKAYTFLLDDCRERGIDIENCPSVSDDPPFSTILLSEESGKRTIMHSNPNFPILTFEHFRELDLNKYKWIHFEARNPDETTQMIASIRDHNRENNDNIKISMDLERLRLETLMLADNVDYVVLGKELARHLSWSDPKAAVYGLSEMVRSEPKPAIICSWAEEGVDCLEPNGEYTHYAPAKVESVVDSVGAGDTFWAATMSVLAQGQRSLREAINFGNEVAGFKLQHHGYDQIKKFKHSPKPILPARLTANVQVN